MEQKPAGWALLLDDNLMSAPRIEAQLQALGLQVLTTRQVPEAAAPEAAAPEAAAPEAAAPEAAGESEMPQLILINLGSRSLQGLDKIEPCRERFPNASLLGFCGHLEIEIRRAAKAKGIGRILTNEDAMSNLKATLNWKAREEHSKEHSSE